MYDSLNLFKLIIAIICVYFLVNIIINSKKSNKNN